jgi:hypothetical protein
MTDTDNESKTPTFISSITWILLGVMVLGAGILYLFTVSVVGSWLWWYGIPVLMVGLLVIYVGYKDFRKFLNRLPDTGESGDEYDMEHSFGTRRKSKSMYDEETLAEKRP